MITEHSCVLPSKKKDFLIHPYELSICGYSGSGKTTLISKLTQILSQTYAIAYFKHNAHQFDMDREGKDTHKIKTSGAKSVLITDQQCKAYIGEEKYSTNIEKQMFVDHDFAIIEGYKHGPTKKILVLEPEGKLLEEFHLGKLSNVIAMVGREEKLETPINLPYFHRDDLANISQFVENYFQEIVATPLYAMIMVGGMSSRMGRDKFALKYNGETQINRVFHLISKFCDRVFISCREEQKHTPLLKELPQIHDRIDRIGPLGGILSAHLEYPNTAWLVVAIDMPHLNEQSINYLIEKRNPFKIATCFYNDEKNWPEPLCAIYEPKSKQKIFQYLAIEQHCPRNILTHSNIELLHPPDKKILVNINTPEEYQQTRI